MQSGFVIKIGPGYPLPEPFDNSDEPWGKSERKDTRYLPLQVEEGDFILFLRKSAIEIEFEKRKYLIVPQSAILLIVREDILGKMGGT